MSNNRATNEAIAAHRDAARAAGKVAITERRLAQKLADPDTDVTAYVKATNEIEQSLGKFLAAFFASDWSDETAKQHLGEALAVGFDDE